MTWELYPMMLNDALDSALRNHSWPNGQCWPGKDHGMLGIEPELTTCKANSLFNVLSLQSKGGSDKPILPMQNLLTQLQTSVLFYITISICKTYKVSPQKNLHSTISSLPRLLKFSCLLDNAHPIASATVNLDPSFLFIALKCIHKSQSNQNKQLILLFHSSKPSKGFSYT